MDNIALIEVRKILPDENQPRKYFAADKMFNLKQSVKKHGIKIPLTVEELLDKDNKPTGKYILIDGERRFRTAVDLDLKEVPCVIEAPKNEADRLIEQFSIQEQHESWTPVEKAMAILNLAKITGHSLLEVCKMLDVPQQTAGRYIAFAELKDKESFVKNEVPLDYAHAFKQLKTTVRGISEKELEVEFTRDDEKRMEHQLTKMIVRGDMSRRSDLSKLSDSFKKEPKLIDKFMTNDKVTPASLFLEAHAQGAHHLRNAVNQTRSMQVHIELFLKIKDVKVSTEQMEVFHRGLASLKKIIDLVE